MSLSVCALLPFDLTVVRIQFCVRTNRNGGWQAYQIARLFAILITRVTIDDAVISIIIHVDGAADRCGAPLRDSARTRKTRTSVREIFNGQFHGSTAALCTPNKVSWCNNLAARADRGWNAAWRADRAFGRSETGRRVSSKNLSCTMDSYIAVTFHVLDQMNLTFLNSWLLSTRNNVSS